jgi:hypothetical protein
MISNTMNPISGIIARVLHWSSTGNAVAWLDRRSGSYRTPQVPPQQGIVARLSNPVARFGGLKHNVIAHRRRLLGSSATIKSP